MSASSYHWNGLSALYQDHERTFILGLIAGDHRDEAEFIHELKATFDGTLEDDGGLTQASEAGQESEGETPAWAPSSSSAPTGHGAFQIPERALGQLARQDVNDRDREREGA